MLELLSAALVIAVLAVTPATAQPPTATKPQGLHDLTPLLGSSPTALCDLGLDSRLTTLLWRARISRKTVGLDGLRATVTSRSDVVDARSRRWTRRAAPVATWTWNGLRVRWYEESFVETAASQRALAGRLALAVPVGVVRATLARIGENMPIAPGRRKVEGAGAGYELTLESAGQASIIECRSNDRRGRRTRGRRAGGSARVPVGGASEGGGELLV